MTAVANLVHETSSTTGSTDFTLAAVNGKLRCSTAFGTGATNVFVYFISHRTAAEWEYGLGYMSDANTLVRLAVLGSSNAGSAVTFSAGTKDVTNDVDALTQYHRPARNAIINGDFQVWQRGTSFTSGTVPANSDDTYLADRWTLLSDGNNAVNVARETATVPTNGLYACSLTVATANKKFGVIQFIEQKNCIGLIGNDVVLSFMAKVSAVTNLDNLKCAIVAWDGTADAVTSDVVSAWGIEGTNPTLVANWTYENTPANLSPTTSYQRFQVRATVDTASAKNIAVFIWSDVTVTTVTTDVLFITDVQLEPGKVASPFARKTAEEQLAECQRYCFRRNSTGTADYIGNLQAFSTSAAAGKLLDFPVNMRVVPTITLSDIGHIAALDATAAAANAFTGSSLSNTTTQTISGSFSGSSGLVAGNATAVRFNNASGWIEASAEL